MYEQSIDTFHNNNNSFLSDGNNKEIKMETSIGDVTTNIPFSD